MLTTHKQSGVSAALQASMNSSEVPNSILKKESAPEFSIKLANTQEEREAAFRLAYQVYFEKGYLQENPRKCLINSYDEDEETITFIVQDQNKNIVSTVSLVFDESYTIPAQRIYASELDELRNHNERIVEVSRLAVNPAYRNSKDALILMFNYLMIYAYHICQYTCLAIEVNPRHVNYYKELLGFQEIGTLKACPGVQDAPAMLLYVSLKKYQEEIIRFHSQKDKQPKPIKKERLLYQYFLAPEQEELVVFYLSRQKKSISLEEKIYFGLIGQAVLANN